MSEWIVEVINPGCGCCSFVPIASFDNEKEAKKFVGDNPDWCITELEDDE